MAPMKTENYNQHAWIKVAKFSILGQFPSYWNIPLWPWKKHRISFYLSRTDPSESPEKAFFTEVL